MKPPGLIPAQLDWRGDQPLSRRFGDIYHAADGAEEVERVFVAPQALTERFACARTFTVGEIGFGTGLNCAVIAQRFTDHAPADARLHIVSVEKHPLQHDDFLRLAARRRRQLPIYAELARHYPPLLPGWHRRHLARGRILLSLYFGDAGDGFGDLVGRQRQPVDAWLLDGFAPDRNPALWDPLLWRVLAGLSDKATTLATFTAAGAVRRGLAAAGFAMRRVDQRPHKRHSLAGEFGGAARPPTPTIRRAIVVGNGLAGAATARQLADRGIAVTVLSSATPPATRIAPTLLHCRLPTGDGPADRVRSLSYAYAAHWYAGHGVPPTGLLQFAGSGMDSVRLESAAERYLATGSWLRSVDPVSASALASLPIRRSALYFVDGRSIDLASLCPRLLEHPRIEQRVAQVTAIETDSAHARLTTDTGTFDTEQVVLCTAAASNAFAQTHYLELVPVWGQLDVVDLDPAPALPLVADGYVAPLGDRCGIGATYEHRPWSGAIASDANLNRAAGWWTAVTGRPFTATRHATARGARAVTSDRNPVVGSVYDRDGIALPRLWLNTGHGSHGLSSAPFGAECVAAMLTGEFAPATAAELTSIASLRFRERQARRGPRHGAHV